LKWREQCFAAAAAQNQPQQKKRSSKREEAADFDVKFALLLAPPEWSHPRLLKSDF